MTVPGLRVMVIVSFGYLLNSALSALPCRTTWLRSVVNQVRSLFSAPFRTDIRLTINGPHWYYMNVGTLSQSMRAWEYYVTSLGIFVQESGWTSGLFPFNLLATVLHLLHASLMTYTGGTRHRYLG
ncbi:hypothetical protein BDW60DRAFT_134649 [Aspergillus nidulans var. acristatus]